MGNEAEFRATIAALESRVDFLETEFEHLDRMLREFGFDEGIKTLAGALNEALDVERLYRQND